MSLERWVKRIELLECACFLDLFKVRIHLGSEPVFVSLDVLQILKLCPGLHASSRHPNFQYFDNNFNPEDKPHAFQLLKQSPDPVIHTISYTFKQHSNGAEPRSTAARPLEPQILFEVRGRGQANGPLWREVHLLLFRGLVAQGVEAVHETPRQLLPRGQLALQRWQHPRSGLRESRPQGRGVHEILQELDELVGAPV